MDALLSRVKVLKERIEATESLITLDLDHRRNRIVEFNLVCHPSPIRPTSLKTGMLPSDFATDLQAGVHNKSQCSV